MRKNKRKKLDLSRETLRDLEGGGHLKVAAAGQTDRTCDVSGCLECLPSEENGCITG